MSAMLLALTTSAIVVLAFGQNRPNLTTWKAEQEDQAAEKTAKVDREKKMAAVTKAVDMLENLRTQILAEGEAEVATYNKFACWCKDTASHKSESIQKAEDEMGVLTARINGLTAKRGNLDTKISTTESDIAGLEVEMKDSDEARRQALKLYETNVKDLMAGLEALRGAIKTAKASKKPSFVQFQSVTESVRAAVLLADALGLGGKTAVVASMFLQETPANEVQMEDYKFHSDDIISTLEGLLKDFQNEKDEVDRLEVSSVSEWESFQQEKKHAKKLKNKELDEARADKEKTASDIAMTSQQMSTVDSSWRMDSEYLDKTNKMCRDKKKTWDERSRARADELATLTQAVGIVSGAVEGNTTANTIRFVQQGTSVRLAKTVALDDGAMQSIEVAAEEADAALAFVQLRNLRGGVNAVVQPHQNSVSSRELIIKLLKSQGQQLRSTMLTSLASKIAADPFAKVKQLIQELIERLLQQASNEATQKGWCDKSIADAKQSRDYAAEHIAKLNSEMAELEAIRFRLSEEIATLDSEITELMDAKTKAQEQRNEEKAQNVVIVKEAKDGLSALDECIQLLDRFYKTMMKNKVSLLAQASPRDDAPDAGFDNGEAYKGAQSEAGGILGMLDVMRSDFKRTITETERAEKQAERDHLEFLTETGKSLAEKNEAKTQTTSERSDVSTKHNDANGIFTDTIDALMDKIHELADLKPVCIDTGMTYNERVSRREDEIASLNKALCVLEKYAEYGPDGAGDSC